MAFLKYFDLKQHTPILHFQYEQQGPSVRVTEIKPKLDKFIINKLAAIDPELYEKYKNVITHEFFPINGKVSSPYKLFVESKNNTKLTIKTYFSRPEKERIAENSRCEGSYFGDLHEGILSNSIRIRIFSFSKSISELIFESLKWLFLVENFGCRTTKGFGSYSWAGHNENDIHRLIKQLAPLYLRVYHSNNNGNFKNALNKIQEKYQILKSGRNVPGVYEKSRMFRFMCKNEIGWEKRWIKLNLTEEDVASKYLILYNKRPIRCGDERNEWEDDLEVEYKFLRALLGLSDRHEYLLDDGTRKALKNQKLVVKIDPISKDIERFASPITFRVLFGNIYVFVNPIDSRIFGQEFNFSAWIKNEKSSSEHVKDLGRLNVPSSSEFNFGKFIDNYLPQLGFQSI